MMKEYLSLLDQLASSFDLNSQHERLKSNLITRFNAKM